MHLCKAQLQKIILPQNINILKIHGSIFKVKLLYIACSFTFIDHLMSLQETVQQYIK